MDTEGIPSNEASLALIIITTSIIKSLDDEARDRCKNELASWILHFRKKDGLSDEEQSTNENLIRLLSVQFSFLGD